MLLIQRLSWVLLPFVLAVGLSEPTPQPSVEPSTAAVPSSSVPPSSSPSDLDEESQDQVAILKQINRVNDDGSYTFGYEAADGSFKIETRDVVGNVKGMFGFVDESGELKRVSYTASNGTGFQTTGSPNVPPLVAPDDGETSTRISLLPTSEQSNLPIYIYKTTTLAPRPEVIQQIPKLRPTPGSLSTQPMESEEITNVNLQRLAYGTALPQKSSTPNYITFPSTTPQPEQQVTRSSFVQIIRPRGYKRVFVTRRPVESSTAATTTENSSSKYSSDLSDEMMEPGDAQRQVDSNSLADTGLITSGTEDSPDVFGGESTVKPFPAGAYQSLFPPLPQYQRILQGIYGQNGVDPRIPPTGGGRYPDLSPNPQGVGRLSQNPYLQQQLSDRGVSGQGQGLPFQDPRVDPLASDPQTPGRISQSQFYRQYLAEQGPESQLPLPPGTPDERLLRPGADGSRFPVPPGFQDPRYGAQFPNPNQGIRGPPLNQNIPTSPDARPYQGLTFPSGRPQILPPPGGRGPLDYSQSPNGRSLPSPPNEGARPNEPYPIEPVDRRPPARQRPQTLPPSSYNPQQGLSIRGNGPDRGAPFPTPYPPPQDGLNSEQTNQAQSYIMEQIFRMLLASQQGQQQQQLTPFQQALLATLRMGNVSPELLVPRNNFGSYQRGPMQQPNGPPSSRYGPPYGPLQPPYGPPLQQYGPLQQPYGPPQQPYGPLQQPYGPLQPFGPQQQPYGPPQQPYESQPPFGSFQQPFIPPQARYDPRYPYPYPYGQSDYSQYNPFAQNNPYQGYNPYYTGSPNPYNQFNPQEALLRMLLSSRFPSPVPQNNPQIQNSQAYVNSPSDYTSSESPSQFNPFDRNPPGSNFGQRINQEAGVVQRSPSSSARENHDRRALENSRGEQSQRSTTYAPREDETTRPRQSFVQRVFPSQRSRNKGSRNVQIVDENATSTPTTTTKP